MARVIEWEKRRELGCFECEIQPGSEAFFSRRVPGLTRVLEMTVASVCQELMIGRIIVGQQIVAEQISAAEYLRRPDGASEDELASRIQDCFRYKDHTLEEYRAVIRALAPPYRLRALKWPLLERHEEIVVTLRNPTRLPVLASVSFGVIQEACDAADPGMESGSFED